MSDQLRNPFGEQSATPGLASAAESQALIQNALHAPGIPRFYANGVGLGLSGGDVICVLFANGMAVGILNLPFVTARGMVDDMTAMLTDLEAAIGSHVPSPKELAESMARVQQAKAVVAPPADE